MATELSRFMNIRRVQPLPVDSALQPSQTTALGTITHVDPIKSVFSTRSSIASSNSSPAWDVSDIKLSAFGHSANFLSSETDIILRQPGLDKLAILFASHRADVKLSEIISEFEKGINLNPNSQKMTTNSPSNSKGNTTGNNKPRRGSLQDFVASTKLKDNLIIFWDNLIFRLVSKSNLDLVPSLTHAIRLSTVLYRASTNPSDLGKRSVGNTRYETVALPGDIFAKPKLVPDNLCSPKVASNSCDGNSAIPWPDTKGEVHPLGWGDLKIIKSTLLRYSAGEIAHIENILAGENHVRIFNDLRRTETIDQLEKETQTEVTSSLQTTDKFSFEQEVATASSGSTDLKTGLTTSGDYGQVTVDASLDYQNKSSKEESQKSSTKYAKDVVASATSKLTQRVRSMQSVSTINEKKEETRFEINNIGQPDHAGIYRWVDKYYLTHVDNYGQRLMYEFTVPEPAAFLRFAKLKHAEEEILKPTAPKDFIMDTAHTEAGNMLPSHSLTDASILTIDNYMFWVSKYGATSVTTPPVEEQYVSWSKTAGTSITLSTAEDLITLPDNCVAVDAIINGVALNATTGFNGPTYLSVILGNVVQTFTQNAQTNNSAVSLNESLTLNNGAVLNHWPNGKLPVSVISGGVWIANVVIRCRPTLEAMDSWRMSTYNSIIQAYNSLLNDYEDKVHQKLADSTNAAFGMNPDINRQTEHIELKKSCLEIITGQRFESIDAMRDTTGDFGFPEFSFSEAKNEGDYIQFFEKAFEWANMTYTFTPYFWGRKDKWLDTLKISDVDPLFENFLRAGSARVQVPARPGYENDIISFFALGWYGMPHIPITIDDPRYVSIVEELKEQAGIFPGMRVEPERWVVKVPTTLVFLENSGSTLPDYTKKLWWQPKLRVIVMDSAKNPIPNAIVTITYLKPSYLDLSTGLVVPEQAESISKNSPNGDVPGSYDFMVDEGTYKIEAVDITGNSSLSPGTAVIEMFQNAEVVITL